MYLFKKIKIIKIEISETNFLLYLNVYFIHSFISFQLPFLFILFDNGEENKWRGILHSIFIHSKRIYLIFLLYSLSSKIRVTCKLIDSIHYQVILSLNLMVIFCLDTFFKNIF